MERSSSRRWLLSFSVLALFLGVESAQSITWEEQAERLQKVGGALLDNYPVGVPIQGSSSIGFRAILSVPPSPDPTVGSKEEGLPESPVQSVPTITTSLSLLGLKSRAWFGYLPAGAEKAFGIQASLTHWIAGLEVQKEFGQVFVTLGGQYGNASLEGPITSTFLDDNFDVESIGVYVGAGYQFGKMWVNSSFIYRSNRSTLAITSDQTSLTFTDTLSDAGFPLGVQLSFGYRWNSFDFVISELWIPDRIIMPRVTLSYTYVFGGGFEASTGGEL